MAVARPPMPAPTIMMFHFSVMSVSFTSEALGFPQQLKHSERQSALHEESSLPVDVADGTKPAGVWGFIISLTQLEEVPPCTWRFSVEQACHRTVQDPS